MTLPPPECKVYTPTQLADAMVRAIEPEPHDFWLDPCVGPGAFIRPLRERGVPKERIVGIDIDPLSGAEDASATTVRGVDFFRWCDSTNHKFTKIIANPPYVAIKKLHPHLQHSLLSLGNGSDLSFTLRSNYWCAFLSACLRVLADHGSLAFVLPAAWDYAQYASDVRNVILQQFHTVHIHRSREPLFPTVREGCVVLVAKGYRRSPAAALRIDHGTSQGLISALTLAAPKPTRVYRQAKAPNGSFVRFSDLFSVNIGCVTGDAGYFLLRESDRIRNGLPLQAVKPVLSKARHLAAAYMTLAEWNRLLSADERVWLFSPTTAALRNKAVRTYVSQGEETCNLQGYKLSRRDPWYSVPDVRENAIGFLSGMTKSGPWISFRVMRGLAATNTLYLLFPNQKMSGEERAAWGLSLLCSPVRKQFREIVRRYPDGLPKLEPHDVNSLRLPLPVRVKGAVELYAEAIECLVSGQPSAATEIANRFIGKPCSKLAS